MAHAPDFTLERADGPEMSLRDLRKRWPEAVFEATGDRQARREEPGDPHRMIVMLLDWDGSVATSDDVGDPTETVQAAVTVDGEIAQRLSGSDADREIASSLSQS